MTDNQCRYCGRRIILADGRWIDPEATGDDSVWSETCDAHDTFTAEHDPVPAIGVRDDYAPRFGRQVLSLWSGAFSSDHEGYAVELPRHDGYMVTAGDGPRPAVRVACESPRTDENYLLVDAALVAAFIRLTGEPWEAFPHAWSPSGARCTRCPVAGTGDAENDGPCTGHPDYVTAAHHGRA